MVGNLCRALTSCPLPRTLRAFRFRQITSAQAIVHIRLADGAQSFIVEADCANPFLQFFGELVQRLEVISRGRMLGLRSLQDLLIAMIDEFRDLATHEISRIGEYLDATIFGAFDCGRAGVLLQKYTIICARSFQYVESVTAKPRNEIGRAHV